MNKTATPFLTRHAHHAARLALCLSLPLLALASAPAHAADGTLNPVNVSGTRVVDMPRTDVRAICPSVDDTVHKAMAPLVYKLQHEGVSKVSFRLQGSKVLSSNAVGGPKAYRSRLERAMHDLECQGDPAVNQAYLLEVSFRYDPVHGATQRVVELRPQDSGAQLASAAATR